MQLLILEILQRRVLDILGIPFRILLEVVIGSLQNVPLKKGVELYPVERFLNAYFLFANELI